MSPLPRIPPSPSRRLQYDKLQAELAAAASQASRLAQENSTLRSQGAGADPAADPALGPDPLAAQQVGVGAAGGRGLPGWLAALPVGRAHRVERQAG